MISSPTTMVGVARLLYRTSSRTALGSQLTSRSSYAMPLSERKALAQSHGGQPGWLKSRMRFLVIHSDYQSRTALSPVVRRRLRMDQYLEQLGNLLFEAYLQGSREFVDSLQGQIVWHCDVAGKIEPVVELAGHDFMNIQHIREVGEHLPQNRHEFFACR